MGRHKGILTQTQTTAVRIVDVSGRGLHCISASC